MNQETSERPKDSCYACEPARLLKIENCPAVLALKDRIERLSVLLDESQNENHVLKRNLDEAKQTICNDYGNVPLDFPAYLHKIGACEESRGRKKALLKLTTQIQELQNHLKQLEEAALTPDDTPPEECARKSLNAERKAFWKRELERRQARDEAAKNMSPINKECNDLRKKLETHRARFRKITKEVGHLKKELQNQIDKSEGDMNLRKSFMANKEELLEIAFDSKNIRDAHQGVKARNEVFGREIGELKDQVRILKEREEDNDILIDTLTGKHKQIQEAIESEKSIVQQNLNRYSDHLDQIDLDFRDVEEICDHIQNVTYEKVNLVKALEELVESGYSNAQEEKPEEETSEFEDCQSVPDSEAQTESKAMSVKTNVTAKPEVNAESTVDEPPINPMVEKLKLQCSKYKALVEAAKSEINRLTYVTSVQENRLSEIAIQVVETGRLIIEKSELKKDFLDKAVKMQKTRAKRKLLPTSNKDFLLNLRMNLEAQREENEFLVSFLKTEMESNVQDTYLYKSFVYDTTNFFGNEAQKLSDVATECKADDVSPLPEVK